MTRWNRSSRVKVDFVIRIAEELDRFQSALNAVRLKRDRAQDFRAAVPVENFGRDHVGERIPRRRPAHDDVDANLLRPQRRVSSVLGVVGVKDGPHGQNVAGGPDQRHAAQLWPGLFSLQIVKRHAAQKLRRLAGRAAFDRLDLFGDH